jgi:hypothetical protein
MALKQFGNQGYVYGFTDGEAAGIAATLGLTPQGLSFTRSPEVEAEGKDIYNRTVAFALDTSSKKSFSLDGYISNAGLFAAAPGLTFVYQTYVFIVTGSELGVKKDDFQTGTLTGVSFSQITDQAGTQIVA